MRRGQFPGAIFQRIRSVYLLGTATIGLKNRQEITAQYGERREPSAILKFHNRQKSRLFAEAFDVGAREPFHPACELLELDIWRQRHTPAAKPQDGRAIGNVWFCEAEYIVKAAASQERRIDALGTICGCQQDHAFDVAQVVNLAQKLANYSLMDVRAELIRTELRCDRIDRVEEEDARRGASGLLENFTQRPLGFAQPLRVQLRTINGDERNLLLARERPRHGSLSSTRWSDE